MSLAGVFQILLDIACQRVHCAARDRRSGGVALYRVLQIVDVAHRQLSNPVDGLVDLVDQLIPARLTVDDRNQVLQSFIHVFE